MRTFQTLFDIVNLNIFETTINWKIESVNSVYFIIYKIVCISTVALLKTRYFNVVSY